MYNDWYGVRRRKTISIARRGARELSTYGFLVFTVIEYILLKLN